MRVSAIRLTIGSLLLALGLCLVGLAIQADYTYERNLVTCNTAPWCGGPPPPVGSFLVPAATLIGLGALVVAWGLARVRRERRGQVSPTGA